MQAIWDISDDEDGTNAHSSSVNKVEMSYSQVKKLVTPVKSFEELSLHNATLEILHHMCFFRPLKVQCYLLPVMLKENNDMVIHAEKKSGKTSTILLVAFNRLFLSGNKSSQAIVVCPTLDLAKVAYEMIENFAKYNNISFRSATRKDGLKKGIKMEERIIVGTPEKICIIINQGIIDKKNIEMIVFDDIQFMLNDKGHENSIFKIVQSTPTASQLIFASSAVSSKETNRCLENIITCKRFCPISVECPITERHMPSSMQYFIAWESLDLKQYLLQLITRMRVFGQSVIVCSSRETVLRVHGCLTEKMSNFRIEYLFGKLKKREAVIDDFKLRKIDILVTTPSFTNLKTHSLLTVVNYDNFLIENPSRFELDMEKYAEWMDVVADHKESMIINFVEKRNATYVLAKANVQIVDKEQLTTKLLRSMNKMLQ